MSKRAMMGLRSGGTINARHNSRGAMVLCFLVLRLLPPLLSPSPIAPPGLLLLLFPYSCTSSFPSQPPGSSPPAFASSPSPLLTLPQVKQRTGMIMVL
jgi:hypothetical protein